MDIAPLSPPGPGAGRDAPAPAPKVTSDFNTFLKMLTVQMQNQNPLDPIDSADYAVQLATFSGVEQQVRTNELLGALSGQLALSGLAEMAGWVGRDARAPMQARFDGAPVGLFPAPDPSADAAELVVRDDQGREVARHSIPPEGGPIEWAGVGDDGTPLPRGLYGFEVVSLLRGEVIGTAPAEVYGTVTEVRSGPEGAVIVMEGGVTVPASQVTALRAGT